jgi:hypothetical protein
MNFHKAFECLGWSLGGIDGNGFNCGFTPPNYWTMVTNWSALAGVAYYLIGIPLISGVLLWFVSFVLSKARRI